jgi:hypothetical protein
MNWMAELFADTLAGEAGRRRFDWFDCCAEKNRE